MIVLGLGSNKGDRLHYLQRAIEAIGTIAHITNRSPVYSSRALMPENAPLEWDRDFLNMAIACETPLSPHALLVEVKAIEDRLGRIKEAHWSPREIDIDILAYHTEIIQEPALTIPHPFLHQRDFALVPFCDIHPDWVHPVLHKTAREMVGGIENTLGACSCFKITKSESQ